MNSLPNICMRCPDPCDRSCRGVKKAQLGACLNRYKGGLLPEDASGLWWSFPDAPLQSPSEQFPDVQTSKEFIECVWDMSKQFFEEAKDKFSGNEEKQLHWIQGQKNIALYSGSPITKQMLEYAYQMVYAPAIKVACNNTTSSSSADPSHSQTALVETRSSHSIVGPPDSLAPPTPAKISDLNNKMSELNTTTSVPGGLPSTASKGSSAVKEAPARKVDDKSPRCTLCHLSGHTPLQCLACKNCHRPGHGIHTCPYGRNQCSNCGGTHHIRNCRVECAVSGCNHPERTYFHPHLDGQLSPDEKAKIRGVDRVPVKTDRSQLNVNRPAINMTAMDSKALNVRPEHEYASYKGSTGPDKSALPATSGKNSNTVVTNYVRVPKTPSRVYMYEIIIADVALPMASNVSGPAGTSVTRSITQRGERKRVFKALCEDSLSPLHRRDDYATDYTTIWTMQPLFSHDRSPLPLRNLSYSKQSGRRVQVDVDLKYTSTLDFSNGSVDLTGATVVAQNGVGGRDPHMLTRALNGMVTRSITSNPGATLFEVGANKFFMQGSNTRNTGLAIHRGYFSSVRPGQSEVLMNINITHTAFLLPMVVSDFIHDIDNNANAKESYGSAESILAGRTVRIMYDRPQTEAGVDKNAEENRKKQIAGFGAIPQIQQFEAEDRMWTVKEWFETHGLVITQPNAPCVNVGLRSTGKELWIPAEFLELEPGQPLGRQLSSDHMATMARTALKHPAANQASIIEEGLPLLGVGNTTVAQVLMTQLSLQTGTALLEIPAEILQAPRLQYNGKDATKVPKHASWNIAFDTFYVAKPISKPPLRIIDLRQHPRPTDPRPTAGEVAFGYLSACKKHGMVMAGYSPNEEDKEQNAIVQRFTLPTFQKGPKYFETVERLFNTALKELANPTFVLILLNDNKSQPYSTIKRLCDTVMGTKTICVTRPKIERPQPSLFSNLVLKHNIKQGGINHAVMKNAGTDQKPIIRNGFAELGSDTMVIGADVIHPGGDTPSIAAIVGSVDGHFATFPGSIRLQPARQEILTRPNMLEMVKERMAAWVTANGKAPSRLLYYRDGVGEDQFSQVRDEEVPEISKAYDELKTRYGWNGQDSLSIAAVIVGKRHNTRFFSPNDSMTYVDKYGPAASKVNLEKDYRIEYRGKGARSQEIKVWKDARNGNIIPGLLVDKVITYPPNPDNFEDFYLQSHAALAGTAKSAHYVIIRNDAGMNVSSRVLKLLTHHFCYDYARATKGVSYCAPAYYADRLCDRAYRYLRSWLDEDQTRCWTMTDQEKNLGLVGIDQFRIRVRDAIANDPSWNRGRSNPWHPAFNPTMFWL